MRWLFVFLVACADAGAQPDPFKLVYDTLMHPRCLNCHPAGDAPLQYDTSVPHGQNITRRSEKNGLPCSACHREKNGDKPNTPPGAPNWHLPPEATPMVFQGRTPKQLCEQLKDPRATGGKDLAKVIEHVEHDALVGWGWDPGPGREPAPASAEATYDALVKWTAAGAPCPSE